MDKTTFAIYVTPIATVITNSEISKILKCSSVAEEIRDSNSPSKEQNGTCYKLTTIIKKLGEEEKKEKKKKKAFWYVNFYIS